MCASWSGCATPSSSSRGRQCTTTVARPTRTPRRMVSGKSPDRRIRSGAGSTGQAESSARPLRRRPARMARPARVRIRSRKPWVLARRRLFGWKVRLDTDTPHVDQVTAGLAEAGDSSRLLRRKVLRTDPRACGHTERNRKERLCHGTRRNGSGQTAKSHPLPGSGPRREPSIIAGTEPKEDATRRSMVVVRRNAHRGSPARVRDQSPVPSPTTCGQTCGWT